MDMQVWNDLQEKRAKLVADTRALLEKVKDEKRELTSEEDTQYKQMFSDAQDVGKELQAMQEAETREKELAQLEQTVSESEHALGNRSLPKGEKNENRKVNPKDDSRVADLEPEYRELISGGHRFTPEYEEAFRSFLMRGAKVSEAHRELLEEYPEFRALQADLDTAGGYLVAPEQFVARLIKDKDNITDVRKYITVIPTTNAASVGFPRLDHDPADPIWTAEIKTGDEDSTMDFEKRAMTPHPLAKRIKVSKKLIRVSAIAVEQLVRERLAYKVGTVEEYAYLLGTGANEPLGMFVDSAAGISSSRDMSTHNTTTALKADNLRACKYELKAQYRNSPGCRWILHKDTIETISKLKDGNGQYLWQPGIAPGDPDRILNYPILESEYAPHTFTTGLYVGLLGDLSQYWVVEALNLQVQVLTELYAETNQNGYIIRAELDGMPVDENAFVRITMA